MIPLVILTLLACDGGSPKPDESTPARDDTGATQTNDTSSTGTSSPPASRWVDEDGDGYTTCNDCNDRDPDIHPHAWEEVHGVDSDCDGVPFDDSVRYAADLDGDGYGDPATIAWLQRDTEPEGWISIRTDSEGRDCDDADPEVNPGAVDVPGDGIDSDCTGSDACGPVFRDFLTLEGEGAAEQVAAFCAEWGETRYGVTVYHTDLVTLEPLACICGSRETLSINGNERLESLAGVEGFVGGLDGEVYVADNPALRDLEGLSGLEVSEAEFRIFAEAGLSLDGLSSLRKA